MSVELPSRRKAIRRGLTWALPIAGGLISWLCLSVETFAASPLWMKWVQITVVGWLKSNYKATIQRISYYGKSENCDIFFTCPDGRGVCLVRGWKYWVVMR